MNMSPEILSLSRKDLSQIALHANRGREIYASYLKKDSGPVSYENLDKVFKMWAEDKSATKPDNEEIANGFGCLFGEMLKAEFGFEWQLIKDQYGTEKALLDNKTGSIIFPINSVLKRIEPEVDSNAFFKPMHEAIKQHIESTKQ